jgi:integrase
MPKASGLPFQTWPPADQALWEAAFRALEDPFSESGRASHLTGETRRALRSSYGTFLRFLSAKHPELLARSPSTRIDRDIAMEYVDWRRCGAATIATGLDRLRLAISYMCPGADISWLLPIAKRLAAQAAPKPTRLHLVTSDQLYAVGTRLMDDAAPSGSDHKADAFRYRDGLFIALPAVAPLRRSTLAALRVGQHLLKSGDLWVLEIPAKDTKTRQSLDFLLSGPLSARIDRYLAEFRDAIPGATKHNGLWPSNKGRPMDGGAIYARVRQRTKDALGFPVNLHRFRHAAATLWSVRDPKNVRGAKDLLGHSSFGTTEKHYVMAQSRLAGRALARAIGGAIRSRPHRALGTSQTVESFTVRGLAARSSSSSFANPSRVRRRKA